MERNEEINEAKVIIYCSDEDDSRVEVDFLFGQTTETVTNPICLPEYLLTKLETYMEDSTLVGELPGNMTASDVIIAQSLDRFLASIEECLGDD